ncbi:hypothetical protein CHUAL_004878 [Chamberlinius hualienensis]
MHSHNAQPSEDFRRKGYEAGRKVHLQDHDVINPHRRHWKEQNVMTALKYQENKSDLVLHNASRNRHVTFQPVNLPGEKLISERKPPRLANMVAYGEEIGIPTVEIKHGHWHQPKLKMENHLVNESEEEYFVDGNFFFNHLVRHKEAEDYNMAEMLRERSRELQRRNVLGARYPQPSGTGVDSLSNDRLSQSLPLEIQPSKRFYYSNNATAVKCVPTQTSKQEILFAGGLEIEIPPRRHGGFGGGGILRQSMSQDRLLMVPSSHKKAPFFGKHYFKEVGYSGNIQTPLSKTPSYSSTSDALRDTSNALPEPEIETGNKSLVTKELDVGSVYPKSRILNPGIEPITNRYNVRTGRLVPSPDFAPKVPPKLYKRQYIDSMQVVTSNQNAECQTRPRPTANAERWQQHVYPDNFSSPTSDNDVQNSHYLTPLPLPTTLHQLPLQPKKSLAMSFNSGPSYTVSPQQNSTINSRKAVTWQDHVSPSHSLTSRLPPSVNYQEEPPNILQNRSASLGDVTGLTFPLSDSLAKNFVIEDLDDVDQFALFEVSSSKLSWGEGFMGTDWLDKTKQYKFVILNRNEEVLFVGVEEESSLSDCMSSPHKSSFSVRILDATGRDVVHFRRLYSIKSKSTFSTTNKTKYRLEVSTPEGHVIGNVEKTYDSDNYYILEDRTGEFMFLVQRSCICTCPLFWDYEFKVLLPESGVEIGEISWSYLTAQSEQFHGTEISFPAELNTISKVMLLGVCFLLNFSRWQSSYLDSIYNPWRRKDTYRFCPWRSFSNENKELAALLRSSPDVNGFQRNEDDVVDDDIELETSQTRNVTSVTNNRTHSLE